MLLQRGCIVCVERVIHGGLLRQLVLELVVLLLDALSLRLQELLLVCCINPTNLILAIVYVLLGLNRRQKGSTC